MESIIDFPFNKKTITENRSCRSLFVAFFASILFSCSSPPEDPVYVNPSAFSYIDQGFFNQDVELNGFTLQFKGDKPSSFNLVIRNEQLNQQWRTEVGKAFLSAALAKYDAKEFAGFFDLKEKVYSQCAGQSLDHWRKVDNAVKIDGSLVCQGKKIAYSLLFKSNSVTQLDVTLSVNDASVGRTGLFFVSSPDEQFFGLGEQFSDFNFKGKRVPVMVSEQGLARGRQPLSAILNTFAHGSGGYWYNSYAPVPHFISSQLHSLALANTEYSIFDFRNPDLIHLQTYSSQLHAKLFFSDTPLGLISEYTSFSGRMRALPDWVNQGAIVGLQGGTEKVRKIMERIQQAGAKVSAVWIQDWSGQRSTLLGKRLWWNWELDREHYPDFEKLRDSLKENGIRMMAYINPFLIDAAQKGDYKRNLYKEAQRNHYLLYDIHDKPVFINQGSFKAYMLDFSNESACRWYKDVIKDQMLDMGFSGWMADFGEAMPFDTLLQSSESAYTLHNEYPVEWAKVNREAINEYSAESAKDTLFFMRSGFTHSPRYSTLFWLGDQATSWDNYDGIKTSVTALLSSGLSGFAFNHGDVGGYFSTELPFTPDRSEELLLRWIELGAFQAVFRTHEGLLPEDNMQVYSNEKLLKQFSRFSKIYAAWAFYRKQLITEASEKGWPVLRHPFLYYPHDKQFWNLSYQEYIIGSELWYAPVLDEGETAVGIYLPKGRWVHAFTGEVYVSEGTDKAISIASPIGTPALLYKEGSLVGEQFRKNLLQQGLI